MCQRGGGGRASPPPIFWQIRRRRRQRRAGLLQISNICSLKQKKSRKRKHFLIKYLKLTFLWIRWLPLHGKNHTSKFKISTRIIIAIDVTVASRIGLLIRPADCFVYIPESADSHPYPHSNKEL